MMISRISGYTPASYNTTTRQAMSTPSFGRRYDYQNHQMLLDELDKNSPDYDKSLLKRLIRITQIPSFTDSTKIPLYLNYIKRITALEHSLNNQQRMLTELDDDSTVIRIYELRHHKNPPIEEYRKKGKDEANKKIKMIKRNIKAIKNMADKLGEEIFAYEASLKKKKK